MEDPWVRRDTIGIGAERQWQMEGTRVRPDIVTDRVDWARQSWVALLVRWGKVWGLWGAGGKRRRTNSLYYGGIPRVQLYFTTEPAETNTTEPVENNWFSDVDGYDGDDDKK